MALICDGKTVETDAEGHLRRLSDWSEALAVQLAQAEGISLTAAHWELIHLVRNYYREYELSPAMRPLVKYTALHLGSEVGNSIHLLRLFPPSPARIISKIAGLPRPDNCL